LRRRVKTLKRDPQCDEVELIEANPIYARVNYPGGRETTVSLQDLAPCSEVTTTNSASAGSVIPPCGDEHSTIEVSQLPTENVSTYSTYSSDNIHDPGEE